MSREKSTTRLSQVIFVAQTVNSNHFGNNKAQQGKKNIAKNVDAPSITR